MSKIGYFVCHESCQVSRLQQTHIEGLLLRSHRCLNDGCFCHSGPLDIHRLTRTGAIQESGSGIACPVSFRLGSGVSDFAHCADARQRGI